MWYNQNLCIMIVLSILVIALFILFAFLKVTGLIEGGNPLGEDFRTTKKEYPTSKPCEFYDDSSGDSYLFNGWSNGDLDTDMYGNPRHPKRYKRAKRREAKFLGKIYVDD